MTAETRSEHQNSAKGQAGVPLEDLGLSTRVLKALKEGGLKTVQDLLHTLSQGPDEFLAIKGVAQKSLEEVQARLSESGLLAGEIPEGTEQKLSPAQVETRWLPGLKSETAETPEAPEMEKEPEVPDEYAGEAVREPQALEDHSLAEMENETTETRISFVVRLTVDEMGRPRRTEIEHAESRNKETSPGLDLEQLGSFMQKFTKTTAEQEWPEPAKAQPGGPGQKRERALRLSISDVQIYPRGARGFMPLAFDPEQELVVEAHFSLRGVEASTLIAQEPPYQMTVYVRDVKRGSTTAVISRLGNLARDRVAYKHQVEVTELPPGLYRLMTFISVLSPTPTRAHYEGPVIQVGEFQPTPTPAIVAGVPNLP